MDIVIRLDIPGLPTGEIELFRLEQLAAEFRAATFSSAKASLDVPAYRRSLGDEERPEYRLASLSEGSTKLLIRSTDERQITITAVERHLRAITDYRTTGEWPRFFDVGERQDWGAFYRSLIRGSSTAVTSTTVDGLDVVTIDAPLVEAMRQEPAIPEYKRVELVGELHLIDVRGVPHFKIQTRDLDMSFELLDPYRDSVDRHRWQRVRAQAKWSVGTRHAQLIAPVEPSQDEAGLTVIGDVETPTWISQIMDRLRRFEDLRDGWLGRGSLAISLPRRSAARDLARRISEVFAERIPKGSSPFFAPTSDGGVEFEWAIEDRELIGEILSDDYDLLATLKGDDMFDGRVSRATLFGWINWLIAGGDPPRESIR